MMVVLPMIVVPLLLCIAISAMLTILGYTQGVAMFSGVDMIEKAITPYSTHVMEKQNRDQ